MFFFLFSFSLSILTYQVDYQINSSKLDFIKYVSDIKKNAKTGVGWVTRIGLFTGYR